MTSLAMTGSLATTGFATVSRGELQRWLISGVIVVMAHVALAAALVHWRDIDDADEPTAGIVIDLAPMPFATADVPMEVPPGPDQVEAEAAPEKPIEKPEEKVEEIVRALDPDVAIEAEPPKPDTPAESQPPAPATTAPQLPRIVNSTAVPTWKRQVVGLLERNKRYPTAAQARHEQGTAQLAFSLDRQGRVTASRIIKSSGSTALDNETLELVKRAQPFPPPPPDLPGAQIDLNVPIRFNIK